MDFFLEVVDVLGREDLLQAVQQFLLLLELHSTALKLDFTVVDCAGDLTLQT